MKTILVGFDGSEVAFRAARAGAEQAALQKAKLRLVYAVPLYEIPLEVPLVVAGDFTERHKAFGDRLLSEAAQKLESASVPVETASVVGSAAEELARCANAEDVSMVVVGSTGKGMAERILMGSVTSRLLRICAKPVLVVR
jgi:nucleotide-binding universal stress UspA family protein